MPAGKRRCLVTFFTDKAKQNSFGERKPEKPRVVCQMWCKIEQLTGRKLERANQVAEETTHELTTLWHDTLEEVEWGEHRGKRYEINTVNNVDNRNRDAVILAKAI